MYICGSTTFTVFSFAPFVILFSHTFQANFLKKQKKTKKRIHFSIPNCRFYFCQTTSCMAFDFVMIHFKLEKKLYYSFGAGRSLVIFYIYLTNFPLFFVFKWFLLVVCLSSLLLAFVLRMENFVAFCLKCVCLSVGKCKNMVLKRNCKL